MMRWCASVGPVVLRAAPGSPHEAAGDRLTIVSWNVNVGGGSVDELVAALKRGTLTGGRPPAEFVLLLQEEFRTGDDVPAALPSGFRPPARIAPAVRGGGREDVRSVAAEHGLALFYAPSMRNGGIVRPVEDRGNAILSTLSLEAPVAIELPLERQRRVALAAAIHGRTAAGSPWRLRLVNVHLDTALALTHGGPFAARRRQAEALVAALADDAEPTVVAGDFNTWRGSAEPALAVLRAAFPTADRLHATTWRAYGLHAQLDHVFARGVRTLDVYRAADRFGSDHYPLIVGVAFN